MAKSWKDQGYNEKQIEALIAAKAAAENQGNEPFTKERWDELAGQAYEPSREPEKFRGPKDTEQVFKQGKEWSEKRNRLHVEMIEKVLAGKPGKEAPTLILLGGGPASGKSFLRTAALAKHPDAVVIDPDEFKFQLPEFKIFRLSDPLRTAARLHEESSYLAAAALEAALQQGNDILLDVVSGNPKKVAALIERFQREGYSVDVRFVDAPVADAMGRMASRAEKTGRWVPPDIVESGHYGAAATFFEVKDLADSAEFWDNSTGSPEKVAEYGWVDKVYNSGRLKKYREKAAKHGRP